MATAVDQLPSGYALDQTPSGLPSGYQLDEQTQSSPQFSPAETFGLGLTNLFGAGDAIGAFVNSRLRGGNYEDWRQKFGQARELANEQNPISHYAGAAGALGLETVLGGALGKGLEAAGEATGLASKFLPWAEAHPLLSKILSGAASGAGYGAAGGAGEALSKGQDVASAALSGAGTGALLGGALGGVAGQAGRMFKELPEAADKALIGELRTGADRATRKALDESKSEILDLVRSDPELMSAVTGKAEQGLSVVEQKATALTAQFEQGTVRGKAALQVHDQLRALTTIRQALEDKAASSAERGTESTLGLLKKSGAVAAVPLALHGNIPAAAAALVTPHLLPLVGKAQRGATEALATLARSAESGNPRALRLLKTIQAGQKVGLAGTGTAVGSATASTLVSASSGQTGQTGQP